MALLDVARRRVRLTDAELALACTLASDPESELLTSEEAQPVVDGLERAGIIAGDRLVPSVAELVGLVASPKLRVILETFVAGEVVVLSAWADERRGALGNPAGPGLIELTPIEPLMLPWAVARAAGLGPRPVPAVTEPVTVTAGALDEATVALLDDGPEAAAAALAAGAEIDEAERAALVAMLAGRRMSWRASSIWIDAQESRRTRTLTVIDGGDGGLWRSVRSEDSSEPVITLEPAGADTLWWDLIRLMPEGEELVRAAGG